MRKQEMQIMLEIYMSTKPVDRYEPVLIKFLNESGLVVIKADLITLSDKGHTLISIALQLFNL